MPNKPLYGLFAQQLPEIPQKRNFESFYVIQPLLQYVFPSECCDAPVESAGLWTIFSESLALEQSQQAMKDGAYWLCSVRIQMSRPLSQKFNVFINGMNIPVYTCCISKYSFNKVWPGHHRLFNQTEEVD